MKRLAYKRSKKSGLPPGSTVHIGEKKSDVVKIAVIDYDENGVQEKAVQRIEECFAFRDRQSITWINIEGVHDTDIITKLGEYYGFHPLMLEDIANTQQRPKMDDYAEYLYIVLKMIFKSSLNDIVKTEQVSFITGLNFVISFQEGVEGDVFEPLREAIRNNKNRFRVMGADYLLYSLIDAIVDSYFGVLENMGEEIETVEDVLILNPESQTLETIHRLKRELITLRKAVWPLRELINKLQRNETSIIKDHTKVYLRDVYDHTIQIIDTVETYRDMVSGMIDIYLSSASNRMNAIMKVLKIIATIFMPLTFLAGVYGMNFKHMPEYEWQYGYPLLWLFMIAISGAMLYFFRRKKWI